jgi:hypothetical protein
MWVDQSLQLTGVLNDSAVAALLDLARKRQAQPIDLADDGSVTSRGHSADGDRE